MGKGKAMNLKLQRITDWPERAHAAKYNVKTLAKRCEVSTRTLERFIKLKFAASPHDWMIDLRMRRAVELLPETACIKETSDRLGYKNQNHFSREFKKHYGHAPTLPPHPQAARRDETKPQEYQPQTTQMPADSAKLPISYLLFANFYLPLDHALDFCSTNF